MPQEGLYLENGVGKTPYEDAQKRAMKPMTEMICVNEPSTLRNVTDIHLQSDALGLEEELHTVTETITRLVGSGTLEKGSHLANTFERFAAAVGDQLVRAKVTNIEAKSSKEVEDITDTKDHIATFKAIAKAVKGNEGKRTLIHLKDVQLSVQTDLDKLSSGHTTHERSSFDNEEDRESKEKAAGLVFREIPSRGNL